ncbi:HAMP domain-containing sensor histidine kinase [Streptomyces sp. G-G2]|uniref:sensor histidine kinase n=1 Tax=Streptomyces sp. G-G2 TaxID=3046201 RepID=UPI0024BB4218|nr:HAMP domain-containing sensor histidine kinase [Streptomyces sp. G-G2]MDJ0385168.1 HAMP domain-containing sensor histidine kinase [Streptomyces sp. G-G2]
MKLATRIALSVTVVVPLLVLAAGLLVLGLVSRDLHRQQDTRLQDLAAAALPDVRTLLAADRNGRPRVEQTQHRRVLDAVLDAGILVRSADGTDVLEGGPQPADPARLPGSTPGGPVTVRAKGHAWRVLSVPVAGAAPGTLWLFAPASATDPQLSAVRGRVLLVALLSAPVSGLLAYALAGRATASVRKLSRRAAELDPRAGPAAFTTTRVNIAEVDELSAAIGQLLARYEEQAARTAQALDTARSFSAAASHELRTPLMSMRTDLDVLAAHPDLSPGERAEVVRDLQSDHARLLELLTALRMLARGDLVEVSAFGPLDLCELVDTAVGECVRRHPGARVSAELPAELAVFGWEAGLMILLANLLGNAVVHGAPPDGPPLIDVRLDARGPYAVLTVDDAGPGIPPGERDAAFRRFHHRPGSPGSGLGLTLVAQQVALHRGTVTLGNPPEGRGTRVEVRLPLLAPDGPAPRLPARRDWISRGEAGQPGDSQRNHKDAP